MDSLAAYKHKLIENEAKLKPLLAQWSLKNEIVVFTNGCFDVLHLGHLHVLASAKRLGSKLVVGLNNDASVKRLKGKERPVFDEQVRQWQLAALACIDAIVLFEQDTPLNLIKTVKPDFLVKGGDYKIDEIVGAEFVIDLGGKVKVIPFLEGFSTTAILDGY